MTTPIYLAPGYLDVLGHIVHEAKKSVSGYRDRWYNPQLHQYAASLIKAPHLHCFS